MSPHQSAPTPREELLILAVDDKPANLIALERVLAGIPARMIKAHSGEEALATSLKHRFALAILDVQMPGMDGYELAELMLGDPATAGTPIIFVTAAYADESHRFKGYDAGAVDYLVKPYDPGILLSKVRIFLELAQHRQDLERMVAERTAELAASELRYRTMFDTMAQGVIYQDAEGRIFEANPAAARILGVPRAALLARTAASPSWDIIGDDGAVLPPERFPSVIALHSGRPVHDVVMGIRVEGQQERTWLIVTAMPQSRPGVAVTDHVLTTFADITARRAANLRVKQSEQALRAVFDGARDGIVAVDRATGAVQLTNTAMRTLLGQPAALGAGDTEPVTLAVDAIDALIDAASMDVHHGIARATTTVELTITRPSGEVRMAQASVFPIELSSATCAIAVIRDMTEQRHEEKERARLKDELYRAQKMDSIGVLAGGIAHDFNNLLSVIMGHVDLALESGDGSSTTRDDLEEVRKAAERSAELTRKLLAFGRKQAMERVPIDLNQVALSTEKLLRRIIGEDIDLSLQLGEELGTIRADAGQIEQVIMNLAVNARDAMPEGGVLIVKTMNVDVKASLAVRHYDLHAGPHVLLRVVDSGCGMDAATLARAFEPFFTTKSSGRGTGLGLATVYGIVKQSDGAVVVNSTVGEGTTFDLYFPRLRGVTPLSVEPIPVMAPAPRGGTETVLVVEDSDSVLLLAVRVLREAGYTVLSATDGTSALRVCEQHEGALDLVLTDVVMPFMNGDEMIEELKKVRPDAKVLFMSGYTGDAFSRTGRRELPPNFIAKPFRVDAMLRMVRATLDGEA